MANAIDGNSLLDKLNELTGYRDELLSQKDSIETDITDLNARIAELKEDLEKTKEELNNKIKESHDIDNNIRTAESTLLKVAGVLNRGENNNNKTELDEDKDKDFGSLETDSFNPQIEQTNYSFDEPITEETQTPFKTSSTDFPEYGNELKDENEKLSESPEQTPFGTSAIDFPEYGEGLKDENEKLPESLEQISFEPNNGNVSLSDQTSVESEYNPFKESSDEKKDTIDNDEGIVDNLFNVSPDIQTTVPINNEVIPTLDADMVNGSDYNSIAQNLGNLQSGEEKVYDMTQQENSINVEGLGNPDGRIVVGSFPNSGVPLVR